MSSPLRPVNRTTPSMTPGGTRVSAGAKVETTNGHQCPATPCAIKMSRKSTFTATITKDGYKPATVQVSHTTANAGAAGVGRESGAAIRGESRRHRNLAVTWLE